MALLDDNHKIKPKPIPGQDRSAKPYSGKSGINPDWEGGQQRGPVSPQDNNTGRFSRSTIDEDYAYQAFREKMLGPLGLGSNSAKTDKLDKEKSLPEAQTNQAISNAQASARTQVSSSSRQKKQLPKINHNVGVDIKAKMTASSVTIRNASWITYSWIFVQLPLAILSILSFGIVAGLDAITKSEGGVLKWIAAKAVSLVNEVAKFIGVDFAEIAFSIAAGLYALILALGLLSILTVYFQYIAAGLRPTTGRGSGLKTGMLLLSIIGYSTPMLNIFPFVLLWMAAVWYHPK